MATYPYAHTADPRVLQQSAGTALPAAKPFNGRLSVANRAATGAITIPKMEAGQSVDFPIPDSNDPQEVRHALETAAQLWGAGSHLDALRWLRRAAETAADSGDDLRSVGLARRAADLRSLANIAGSMPPPASVPAPGTRPAAVHTPMTEFHNPAQTVPATPAAGATAARREAPQEAPAPASGGSVDAEVLVNAPRDLESRQSSTPGAESAPNTPSVQARSAAAAAKAPLSDPDLTNGPTPVEGVAAFGRGGAREASSPDLTNVHTEETMVGAQAPHRAGFQTHNSVRVALSPKPDQDGQFSVHPLAEGEAVDPGWQEALLVSLSPGKRLFPGRD